MIWAPIDIEDELREALDSQACHVFAPPVPPDLERRLPCCRVRNVGGVKQGLVSDRFNVVCDVWAERDAEAAHHARRLAGEAVALQWEGGRIRRVDVTGAPYQSNDPQHPTLARYSFSLTVSAASERS